MTFSFEDVLQWMWEHRDDVMVMDTINQLSWPNTSKYRALFDNGRKHKKEDVPPMPNF